MPDEIAFTVNIPIRSQDSADVKAAIAFVRDYRPTVIDGEGNEVPNPMTQEDLVRQFAQDYILSITQEYIVREAAEAAKAAAVEAVESRTAEVTAWFDERRMNSIRPTATAQSLSMEEDGSAQITLEALDPNNRELVYSIVTPPEHGTLSGTLPLVTYTPEANWHGVDSFTFQAANTTVASEPALVDIEVVSVIDALQAFSQSLSILEDRALEITLAGFDPEGEQFEFMVMDQPANGVLSGTVPNLTYTPNSAYSGSDSFTFKTSTATRDSALATVSITVVANTPPSAFDLQVIVQKSSLVVIELQHYETEKDAVTWTILSQPSHGTLQPEGIGPNVFTYTPELNYVGYDSFTCKCNDGKLDSNVATVNIQVFDDETQ